MTRSLHPGPLLAAALLLWLPGAMAQTSPPAADAAAPAAEVLTTFPPVKGVTIKQAAFGIFEGYDTAQPRLQTARVVYRDGSQIGWVVDLVTANPKVRWREEFVTPVPPQQWGLAGHPSDVRPPLVSKDRRTATTERLVPAGGSSASSSSSSSSSSSASISSISHWWKLDPTDPAGRHTMRVYVEDVLVATFEFDVR